MKSLYVLLSHPFYLGHGLAPVHAGHFDIDKVQDDRERNEGGSSQMDLISSRVPLVQLLDVGSENYGVLFPDILALSFRVSDSLSTSR